MALEFAEKALVVDCESERPGRRLEIGAIDEKRNLVGSGMNHGDCP